MGRKCNVLHCLSDSRRIEDQGVTFHKMPTHTDLRPKWLSLCRIPEERKNVKVIYVCSRHFLRADFCNFKGTKYMLKQGALPSVFPWSKNVPKSAEPEVESKVNKNIPNKDDNTEISIKTEIKSEPEDVASEEDKKIEKLSLPMNEDNFKINEEISVNKEPKKPIQTSVNMQQSSETVNTINFVAGTRIEANDFHDKWYSAEIVEVDQDENEVFIRFEKCPNRGEEWIPMDSSRLRPLQPKGVSSAFQVGERCLATWSDTRRFPATIKRIIDSGM